MTESYLLLNLSIELSGAVLCAAALLLLNYGPKIDREARQYFFLYFCGCILLAASNMAGLLMRGHPGSVWRAALYVSNYTEFLAPALLAYIIISYVLSIVDPERQRRGLRRWAQALLLAHIVLLTVSQFTGLLYTIDADNVYQRRMWYPLSYVPVLLITLSGLVMLLRNRRAFTKKEYGVFLIFFTLPELSAVLQVLQYGINFSIYATIVIGIIVYILIVGDQTEQYEREQKEVARQRASILVLQMRPHFIYNTMTSIYYLTRQDPERAQQVILDFTSYLRKNFTAIAREDLISFAEELEHTRAYLAVEQTRFEGQLFVEFDTPFTQFRLPPLTLQPIVENAVRHGLDPDLDPLYITITTRETPSGVEITVEDTGPGYSPADDREPHIALANIRERLHLMCSGSLEISARPAGGTIVTVTVSKQKK